MMSPPFGRARTANAAFEFVASRPSDGNERASRTPVMMAWMARQHAHLGYGREIANGGYPHHARRDAV